MSPSIIRTLALLRPYGAAKYLLVIALLLIAPMLHAQMIPFDAEVGYRWLGVSGNEAMYRTQINERSGLLIRNLTLATGDFEGHTSLVSRFRLDISDLGVGPAGITAPAFGTLLRSGATVKLYRDP